MSDKSISHLQQEIREKSKTGVSKEFLAHLSQEISKIQLSQRTNKKISKISSWLHNQEKILDRISPALYPVYLQLTRILFSLRELWKSDSYTIYDVNPLQARLDDIEQKHMENNDFVKNRELLPGQAILRSILEHCYRYSRSLLERTEQHNVDPALHSLFFKLHKIRRKLELHKNRQQSFNVEQIQTQMEDLQHSRISGKFVGSSEETIDHGSSQWILNSLMTQNFEVLEEILACQNSVPKKAKKIHDKLIRIKEKLDHIMATEKYLADAPVILNYYKMLVAIDQSRVNGKFPEIDEDDEIHSVLHYLLHKCFRLVYELLSGITPVDDSLRWIQQQLLALRRCLQELKISDKGFHRDDMYHCLSPIAGRCDPILRLDDLKPIKLKLKAIDDLRVDGKFLDADGRVPEGQSTLHCLLNECFDFVDELAVIAEHNEMLEEQYRREIDPSLSSSDFDVYFEPPNLPVVPLVRSRNKD